MLSKEELIQIGVNPDNLCYPHGEMNVIVQCFGFDEETIEAIKNGDEIYEINPDIYQPRKNKVWSCGCQGDGFEIIDEDDKKNYVSHLRDSAERLKIMSHYLMKQAEEIETIGYPITTCYYPE